MPVLHDGARRGAAHTRQRRSGARGADRQQLADRQSRLDWRAILEFASRVNQPGLRPAMPRSMQCAKGVFRRRHLGHRRHRRVFRLFQPNGGPDGYASERRVLRYGPSHRATSAERSAGVPDGIDVAAADDNARTCASLPPTIVPGANVRANMPARAARFDDEFHTFEREPHGFAESCSR